MIKTHRRKKTQKYRGKRAGTYGWGARKKHKKSGHRGGKGMAGSGKRGDQKKTLVQKLYGNKYFGKQGITSKGTQKNKSKKINLSDIETNLENFIKKGIAKKTEKGIEVDLGNYKILGDGAVKNKLFIKALGASEGAKEKVKKSGGDILVKQTAEEKE